MEMKNALARYCFLLTMLIFLVMIQCSSEHTQGTITFDKLPSGWRVTATNSATVEQVRQISRKLGCQINDITSYQIKPAAASLKMIVTTSETTEETKRLFNILLKLHKNDHRYVRRLTSTKTIEFSGGQAMVTKLRYFLFGDYSDVSTWDVQLKISLVKSIDPAQRNRFFNLLSNYSHHNSNARSLNELKQLIGKFQFQALNNNAAEKTVVSQSGLKNQLYFFRDYDYIINETGVDRTLSLPYITLSLTCQTSFLDTVRRDDMGSLQALTHGNAFWPTEDVKVNSIIEQLNLNTMTDRQKIRAIHNWIIGHIKFDQTATGTRRGVLQTINTGLARCWDFSDVSITILRAAGIPCRQVYGWLYQSEGHVWTEVYVHNSGWI